MAIKIDKKIKGYSVLKPEDKAKEAAQAASSRAPPSRPSCPWPKSSRCTKSASSAPKC